MNNEKTFHWLLDDPVVNTVCQVEDAFSSEEVNKIIEAGEKEDIIQARVIFPSLNKSSLDKSIRSSNISWLTSNDLNNEWLFRRLTDIIFNINKNYFKFDLTAIQNLQYSIYNVGGFYTDHVDATGLVSMTGSRKLSFSIMLTDPEEYAGGDLLLKDSSKPIKTTNKKGSIIFFPSYVLHEVTPVTKGTRKALVGWVMGPNFK